MVGTKNIAFIGLGGAGNTIVDSIIKQDRIIVNSYEQTLQVNFSVSDIDEKSKSNKIIVYGNGTGRSYQKGLELVDEKKDLLQKNYLMFYQKVKKFCGQEDFTIVIISSLGGGSGAALTPFTIDFFQDLVDRDENGANISYVGIVSSPKEGVATLPNCVKSFKNIYNTYVLTDKLKSCYLFDNRKFEKTFGLSTYDFQAMNALIVDYVADIYDEESYQIPANGFQTLDVNEIKRVMMWGKGISDFAWYDFSFNKKKDEEQEIKIHSNIFGGSLRQNTAKAIACFVQVKKKDFDLSSEELSEINTNIQRFKKKFSSAFFVFGFNFANKTLPCDYRFRVISNGFDFPHSFESDVNKATKDVAKLKKENNKFEISSEKDLDF